MNLYTKLAFSLLKAANIKNYGSTESGRSTNLTNYNDYNDNNTQAWDVTGAMPGFKEKLLLVKRLPENKDDPRVYAFMSIATPKNPKPTALAYLALKDIEGWQNRLSEIVGLKTEVAHRRKGLASGLLAVASKLENKNLVVHPDPMSDKSVTRENIEKMYLDNGFKHVDKTDPKAPLIRHNYVED